jgi:hypothetical protein
MLFMSNLHKQTGAAMTLFIIFFTFAATGILLALGQAIYVDHISFNRLSESKQAYIAVETLTDDVVMRNIYSTYSVDTTETLSVGGAAVTAVTTYDSAADLYTISSEALFRGAVRKTAAELSITGATNLSYGLFSGTGGIALANSSRVIGNTYANGPVTGAGSAVVLGDIVSAGPSGLIQSIAATGSVFANTIDNVTADGDAHYTVAIGSNSIGGTSYSPAVNQATATFPVSGDLVQEWKDAVNDYGTVISATDLACSGGTYVIDATIPPLGYVRIECNVEVQKTGTTLTVNGPIWVEGNLTFTQGPTIRVDPALGRRSVQFIVDNPSDRLTSSQIEIRNQTDFLGSGDPRSYIMLYSANESYSTGGSETAIAISQSADGNVIMYADSGLVDVSNGVELRAVTGYQIDVAQNSDIIYEEGLSNLVFTAGPGSGYILTDWQQAE